MPPSLSKDLPLPAKASLSWRQRLGDWLYHFGPLYLPNLEVQDMVSESCPQPDCPLGAWCIPWESTWRGQPTV